jgi:hypothetical protein
MCGADEQYKEKNYLLIKNLKPSVILLQQSYSLTLSAMFS